MSMTKIELDENIKNEIIHKIQQFFLEERDEEIGVLSASIILDFFIEKLGSTFYNLGLHDAIIHMKQHVDDLYGLER